MESKYNYSMADSIRIAAENVQIREAERILGMKDEPFRTVYRKGLEMTGNLRADLVAQKLQALTDRILADIKQTLGEFGPNASPKVEVKKEPMSGPFSHTIVISLPKLLLEQNAKLDEGAYKGELITFDDEDKEGNAIDNGDHTCGEGDKEHCIRCKVLEISSEHNVVAPSEPLPPKNTSMECSTCGATQAHRNRKGCKNTYHHVCPDCKGPVERASHTATRECPNQNFHGTVQLQNPLNPAMLDKTVTGANSSSLSIEDVNRAVEKIRVDFFSHSSTTSADHQMGKGSST